MHRLSTVNDFAAIQEIEFAPDHAFCRVKVDSDGAIARSK